MSLFLVYATVDCDGCAQLECEEVGTITQAASKLLKGGVFPHESRIFSAEPLNQPLRFDDLLKNVFNKIYEKQKEENEYREYRRLKEKFESHDKT